MNYDIEELHYRETLQEEGIARDLIVELNRTLSRLRDLYGPELSRRSALRLHDERLSYHLQDILDDLSFHDEVLANFWLRIADDDLAGDYIPETMEGGFYGLNQIGQMGDHYWVQDVEHE